MCRKKIVELVLLSQQAGNAPPAVFCTNTSWDSTGGRNLHVSPELKSIDREAEFMELLPPAGHICNTQPGLKVETAGRKTQENIQKAPTSKKNESKHHIKR